MLDAIDAAAVRRWARAGVDALAGAREEIDALNVYPVPDGDTGTNLYLTVEAAAEALDEVPGDADLPTTASALAGGALLGARGNSGIILSQIVRGLATTFDGLRRVDGATLARALRHAAELAYAAVARPVEGTMLTVARAAADAAERAGDELSVVTRAASDGAREALAHTPDQLDVLRRAGVVDAGGRGLCVLLDALVGVVTGAAPADAAPGRVPLPAPRGPTRAAAGDVGDTGCGAPPAGRGYEVMYLLDADDAAVAALRAALEPLGDSLVVVGGDGLWNVHVHVDDAGAAIEAGLAAGRPHRIRVTSFATEAARQERAGLSDRRGIVAVVAGDGLAALLEAAGATVVRGGPGHRASTRELLKAVHGSGAGEVVLLPNDADSLAVADAAARQARLEGFRVAVVPTRATVQALAAVAVHDPTKAFDDDVVAMTAAGGQTRHGAVTVAARAAMTTAGPCRPGDVLGVVGGDFAVVGDDLAKVAREVLERLLAGGGELITLVTGEGAPPALVTELLEHLRRAHPDVDAAVHEGGQPRYPLLVGVE